MSEMIERVANSVRTAFADAELNNPRITFEELTEILARAAIEAMREPTEEMALAVRGGIGWGSALEGDWHTMIDAALKP